MPTIFDLKFSTSSSNAEGCIFRKNEGDWELYRHRINHPEACTTGISFYGDLIAYRRACAMSYLGKRAQSCGGICSVEPVILTPQFIADLSVRNETRRYSRYPWMRLLLNLQTQIQVAQDQGDSSDNVISLIGAEK
jgi:hypothetical protein